MEIEIVYADDNIVVVNKPGGLLAVPGRGPENRDCVSSRLQARFPEMIPQPAVHRLDMYTSGLMVYAIDKESHRQLSGQFSNRLVRKRYIAVVEGKVGDNSGEIRLHFRLDPENRPLQVYDPEQGKLGISLWRKMGETATTTTIEFTPITGRTHQLRLHAAHPKGLGTPIVGDSLYGSGKDGDQMLLHACLLQFAHPVSGEKLKFESSPPFSCASL